MKALILIENMIKINVLIFILVLSINTMVAQKQYLTVKDSDKEALDLWKKSKNKLETANTLVLDFKMTIQQVDMKPEIINGIAKQKAQKYFIEAGNQYYYCDGTSLILYKKVENIAQINSLDENSGNVFTPSSLLKQFDDKKFIFVMEQIKGKSDVRSVLLKPTEKRSEYSKIQLLINSKTLIPSDIKIFNKDGSRTFIKINSMTLNQNIENNVFIFNKTDHPGVSVEDLRMD